MWQFNFSSSKPPIDPRPAKAKIVPVVAQQKMKQGQSTNRHKHTFDLMHCELRNTIVLKQPMIPEKKLDMPRATLTN